MVKNQLPFIEIFSEILLSHLHGYLYSKIRFIESKNNFYKIQFI